ncbi:MAG: hypothetical protein KDI45_10310 [Candidatus Accumulibacter sp.]|nr:hypothetical protein [Accumulibacter sp.]
MRKRNDLLGSRRRQSGIALMAMLLLVGLWGLYLFVGQLNATQSVVAARQQRAATALAQAREALVGDAVSRLSVGDAGYLRLPDLGSNAALVTEGYASLTFAGEGKDLSVIGKFPWKTISAAPLRDQDGECLWYVVSGRFKNSTPALKTDVFNWDTLGQIDVIGSSGNVIARNLAALIVAPGRALGQQSRALAAPAYAECGGNYDARNYLDPFNYVDAAGVNYFLGGINNRVAANTSNRSFIASGGNGYNDRFIFVTVDHVFDPLIRRSDFAAAIGALLDDPTFRADLKVIPVVDAKGTGDTKFCRRAKDPVFCENWKEMLWFRAVGASSCDRILIFAGRKTAGQRRGTSIEKATPSNYLEEPNASAFVTPTATAADFSGAQDFDFRNPGADLVRCF